MSGWRLYAAIGCSIVMLAVNGASAAAENQGRISVGSNVLVSSVNNDRAHYEVLLDADPNDKNRLIGCSGIATKQPGDTAYGSLVYVSSDGGLHWHSTLEVGDDSGDPACAFGNNGVAYFVTLADRKDVHGKPRGVTLVYRSADGGEHWSGPVELPGVDRDFISVDTTRRSGEGTVYINGAGSITNINDEWYLGLNFVNTFATFVSHDGGVSFPRRTWMAPNDNQYVFAQGTSTVTPSGKYGVIFADIIDRHMQYQPGLKKPMAHIKFITSDDRGQTFSKATVIADSTFCDGPASSGTEQLVTDRSNGPFRGRLYAAWDDQQTGRCQIMFSSSNDGGATWSAPYAVNDDRARKAPAKGPDDSVATLAVSGRGVVGLLWQDRRSNADDLGYQLRFAASLDGGDSFTPSVAVSSAPAQFNVGDDLKLWGEVSGGGNRLLYSQGGPLKIDLGYNQRYDFIGGDTDGLAASQDGAFHALWIDNRSGLPQVWTAAVSVAGTAVRNGSRELAALEDVTQKVTLDIAGVQYDRSSGILSARAYLANTSHASLRGPLKVRVTRLTSKLGDASVVGSDNGAAKNGAVWDFTHQLSSGALRPGQRSNPKLLAFKIDVSPQTMSSASGEDLTHFVSLQVKAFASVGHGAGTQSRRGRT